jgi:hypothetical protein
VIKKIIIPYFPKGMKYATPVIAGLGIFLMITGHPVWGSLFLLPCPFILTTNYVTEINFDDKVYRDYIVMLGIAMSKEVKRFNHIDRIIITKGNYSQTLNTRVQSRQMNWSDYTGTLIHDGTGRLDLLTRTDKDELVKELVAYAAFLKVGIEDRTTRQHYWVDMNKVMRSLG